MGDKNPCDGAGNCRFEVLGEPAASAEPGKGSFDHPSARENFESPGGIGPLDDLDGPISKCSHRAAQLLAGIASVGKNMAQPGIERTDRCEDADGTVTILDVGRVNLQADQMAGCVGDDVPLCDP